MGSVVVRVGPKGSAVGPFDTKDSAIQWLEAHGYPESWEGVTWRMYDLHDPDLGDPCAERCKP